MNERTLNYTENWSVARSHCEQDASRINDVKKSNYLCGKAVVVSQIITVWRLSKLVIERQNDISLNIFCYRSSTLQSITWRSQTIKLHFRPGKWDPELLLFRDLTAYVSP